MAAGAGFPHFTSATPFFHPFFNPFLSTFPSRCLSSILPVSVRLLGHCQPGPSFFPMPMCYINICSVYVLRSNFHNSNFPNLQIKVLPTCLKISGNFKAINCPPKSEQRNCKLESLHLNEKLYLL